MIDIWQEIYSTIKRNKLRTFLTGFAVAWGIFMLIVLLGAGNGLIHAFEQSASERAMNSIKIYPGWTSKSYDGLKEGRRIRLDNKDLNTTNKNFPDHVIKAGATVYQGGVNLSFGSEYVNLNLSGVYPNHTEVEVVKLFKGRFINEIDIKERRKVIVLHKKTAEILFDKTHTDPIGQFVNAGNVVYHVVGLYNDKGDSGDSDAYLPFTTLQTIYNKGDKLNNLIMTTKNLETIESNEEFEAHYRKVIGANQRFDPTDHSAIWIWKPIHQLLATATGVSNAPYRYLGNWYFYLIKRDCRSFEHHADYCKRTYPRIWHPQSTRSQTSFHPLADYRRKCHDYHHIRLHRHGCRHRCYRMDEQYLRKPDYG